MSVKPVIKACPHCQGSLLLWPDSTVGVCSHCFRNYRVSAGQPRKLGTSARTALPEARHIGRRYRLNGRHYAVYAAIEWRDGAGGDSVELLARDDAGREISLEVEPGDSREPTWWLHEPVAAGQVIDDGKGEVCFEGQRYRRAIADQAYRIRRFAGCFTESPDAPGVLAIRWHDPTGRPAIAGASTRLGLEKGDPEPHWFVIRQRYEPTFFDIPDFKRGSPAMAQRMAQAGLLSTALLATMLALLVHLSLLLVGDEQRVYDSQARTASGYRDHWLSETLHLSGRTSNVRMDLVSTLANNWALIDACLVARSGRRYCADKEWEHYFGRDGGEYWSEGSANDTAWFSSVPAGDYVFEAQVESGQEQLQTRIYLVRDSIRHRYLGLALLLITLIPALLLVLRTELSDRYTYAGMVIAAYGFGFWLAWP